MVGRRGRFLVVEPLFEPGPQVSLGGGVRVRGGEMVLAEQHGARARVLAELGDPARARDVAAAVIYDRDRERGFDGAVEEEARAAAAGASELDPERRDLTALDTFTVDPATARDFDDAVSAAPDGDGIRLWIHIADVAAHVRPGSRLDDEAERRATSVYVPGTVEPMLPAVLSDEACSLAPGGRPAGGDGGDPARGRRGGALRALLPQPGPLRRAPLLRPARRVLRRSRAAPRADRGPARPRAPRRGRARGSAQRLGARDLDHGAGVRVRRQGRRDRRAVRRADRGARADRAVDDLHQRARRRAPRAPQDAHALPRPRAPGRRARGGHDREARRPRRAHATAAGDDLAERRRRAGGRRQQARDARGRAPRARPGGVYITRAPLAQAGLLLAAKPRSRRARQPGLLSLHLADPPLSRPDRAPRPALRHRRGRGRARAGRRARRRHLVLGARARGDGDRTRCGRRLRGVPARARALRGRP